MILKARWKSISRAIVVISMTIIFSMLTNIATAGLNDVLIKAAEHGEIYAVKSILDNGADVNAKMNDGMTSLMYASLGGHLEVVRALIAKGADINAKTKDGVSSLMYASLGGHLEIVRALIAKDADVNAKTNDGKTVLIVASKGGDPEIVKALLSKGADVTTETTDGMTALLVASANGHKRIEELLKEAATQVDSLPSSAKPVEAALQPVSTTHAEGRNLSPSASAPVQIAIPVIPPIAEQVATPAEPKISEPALTAATPYPPSTPSAEEKVPEQKRVFYTLSAGETVSRSKLNILVKKLKASGLQPVFREENKTMDVYRLVTECFSEENTALQRLSNLARKEKNAFSVRDGEKFCVAAASYFSYGTARTEQNRFAKKDIPTEIVQAQVPLTSWQVTVGRYNDSQSAAAELKRLAKQGIHVVLIPLDK